MCRQFPAYCARYRAAEACLNSTRERSARWTEWLKSREAAASAAPGGQCFSVDSALIRPLQKVPQYAMLLGELRKRTPESHPDRAHVEVALAQMLTLASECNERVRANIEAGELQRTIAAFGGNVLGGEESKRKFNAVLGAGGGVMPRIVKQGVLLKRNRRERWESLIFFLLSNGRLVYVVACM